jgi:hypothetical protein
VGATTHETLAVERHAYAHGLEVEITFIRCTLDSHAFVPSAAVHEVRWTAPGDVDPGEVLEADRPFLQRLGARA